MIFFFFQAEDGIRDVAVTGVQTCALPIFPDELTNSLLIRASQADFDVMKEAVDQLDIRPLQVLIEVLIVETRHDRSLSIGEIGRASCRKECRTGGVAYD